MRIVTKLASVFVVACGLSSLACTDNGVTLFGQSDAGTAGGGGAGGSGGGPVDAGETDPSAAIFDVERVLDVVIDMAPEDWDSLRHQSRSLLAMLGEGCQDGPNASPYTYFPATVTVDGQKLEMSAVRKKGFLGSASLSKPSLKISFDEFVSGREFSGVEGLTLNNSKQDPSLLKTCLAFKMFRDAGVPASRCSFAHVTLNGTDMGLYMNVEPITKRFLRRHFADGTGNLYEGQLSDVRPGFSATYEKKTNTSNPDRSDLDALASALTVSDAELEKTLATKLDIDAFLTFWAMEALLATWDGYTGNLNNHFVYDDPTTNQMHYLPWGPDMSFDTNDPFHSAARPQSVSAKGHVARRLYDTPAFRDRYGQRMNELLNSVWKESEIQAEIDRLQKLMTPYLGDDVLAEANAATDVRNFVAGRRSAILAEISPTPPAWPYAVPAGVCMSTVGKVSGAFSTTYGTLAQMQPFVTGQGSFTTEIPIGTSMVANSVGASAGIESGPKGRRRLDVVGKFPDGTTRAMVFLVDPEIFASGKDGPFDWQSVLARGYDIPTMGSAKKMGLAADGVLHFDQASSTANAPVSGTFNATLITNPF